MIKRGKLDLFTQKNLQCCMYECIPGVGWRGNKLCVLEGYDNTAAPAALGEHSWEHLEQPHPWPGGFAGALGAPWSRRLLRGAPGPFPPGRQHLHPVRLSQGSSCFRGLSERVSGAAPSTTRSRRWFITSVPHRTGILMPGYKLLMYFAAGH